MNKLLSKLKQMLILGLAMVSFEILPKTGIGFKSAKTYAKKLPYQGFGKPSKVTGLPRTKIVRGHGKWTKSGYTYVNPYAKSK